jgi:hypothetical protein
MRCRRRSAQPAKWAQLWCVKKDWLNALAGRWLTNVGLLEEGPADVTMAAASVQMVGPATASVCSGRAREQRPR